MTQVVQVESVHKQWISDYKRLDESTTWQKAKILHDWSISTKSTDKEIAAQLEDISESRIYRLRMIWQVWHETYHMFKNLSASHFAAALGWDDAKKWIHKANENNWSKAQMVEERDKANGKKKDPPPKPAEKKADAKPAKPVEKPADSAHEEEPVTAEEGESDPIGDILASSDPISELPPPAPALASVAKPALPVDQKGNKIPPQHRDIFETSPLLAALECDLAALEKRIEDLDEDIRDKNPVFFNRVQPILTAINTARREIRFATPYVICSSCGGAGCTECRKIGWIEKDTYSKRGKK